MVADPPRRAHPWSEFLRVRSTSSCVLLAVMLGVTVALIGQRSAAIPVLINRSAPALPTWRLLAMGAGVLPALSLHSSLSDLEHVSTSKHREVERRYLVAVSGVCMGAFIGGAAVSLPMNVVLVVFRSLLAWLGLALVSGRVLSWRLAWVLPAVVLAMLLGAGGGGGGQYAWWEFSVQEYDNLPSLLLSLLVSACGLLAFASTPWRIAGVRRAWRGS